MIFRQQMVDAILAGTKTVTRRPVKTIANGGGAATMATPLNLLAECRYRVGKDYALQGPPEKGSRARARTIPGYRLRVLRVDLEELDRIDLREAQREGFESRDEFEWHWCRLYGGFSPAQLVHRIEFEVVR